MSETLERPNRARNHTEEAYERRCIRQIHALDAAERVLCVNAPELDATGVTEDWQNVCDAIRAIRRGLVRQLDASGYYDRPEGT